MVILKKYKILTVLLCILLTMTAVAMADTVARGSRGNQVQHVQTLLITQGYLMDKADGVFGNNTEYAVRAFQKSKGLSVTGKVDDGTLARLEENNKLFTPAPAPSQASRNVRSATQAARFGDRGRTVADLQTRLADSGFSPGDIDGVYGNGTSDAVKRFQRHHGLAVTGEADGKTMSLLSQRRGLPENYRSVLTMEASAYSAEDPGNGHYTARGNRLRKGYVSVDPAVIPLGTELYIEGYGYAVADDIGGAIVGNRIDLAMNSRSEALHFGRRTVTVYVLNAK